MLRHHVWLLCAISHFRRFYLHVSRLLTIPPWHQRLTDPLTRVLSLHWVPYGAWWLSAGVQCLPSGKSQVLYSELPVARRRLNSDTVSML